MTMTPGAANIIVPVGGVPVSVSETWRQIYMDKLDDVLTSGDAKPKYKNNKCQRAYNVIVITCCATTICVPIIVYDSLCCCLSLFCHKNPFRSGCSFEYIVDSCDKTFEDQHKTVLTACKKNIDPVVFARMCQIYLGAFDRCLVEKKAKEANIIRGLLVEIIRGSAPGFACMYLQDDGDVNKLRRIVENYVTSYLVVKS